MKCKQNTCYNLSVDAWWGHRWHLLKWWPSHTFFYCVCICVCGSKGREEKKAFTSTNLCEIWDTVSIPQLHCMYCYCFLLWIQHVPLDTDWMGLRKATSSLWDLRWHRKQIFCVSCPLIKNTEGIKNGTVSPALTNLYHVKLFWWRAKHNNRPAQWYIGMLFPSEPSFLGELSLLQLSAECHCWFNHHYFCHDFMSSARFIIFCEVSVAKGQWWRFLTSKCTVALWRESLRHTKPAQLHTCWLGWRVNMLTCCSCTATATLAY